MSIGVRIGIPTTGHINSSTVMWLIDTQHEPYIEGITLSQGQIGVERQRNDTVKEFLKSKDATHLFFLDDDVVPPLGCIKKMLDHNKDLVSAAVPMYRNDGISYSVFDATGRSTYPLYTIAEESTKLVRVDAVGAACMLIKRRIFEEVLEWPWFEIPLVYEDNERIGEDIQFCRKLAAKGVPIFCDWRIKCKHIRVAPLFVRNANE